VDCIEIFLRALAEGIGLAIGLVIVFIFVGLWVSKRRWKNGD
jgi:uncharacterized membrane protein YccC